MAQTKLSSYRWRRSAVAAAAGLCLASIVYAQQTTGSINGRVQRGEAVTVENTSIGISRQTKADENGSFQVGQLPPGTYKVTVTRANGSKETVEVLVTPGLGAFAAFTTTQQVVVTGSAVRSLDVTSVGSTYVVSKAEIDRTPVTRDVTAVTLLAPGAVFGDGRIGQTGSKAGNVPSIAGASPAENVYYINGFNVTNIVNGVAFNQVPFEAIANIDVKKGGFGPEYGRALGGVVTVTTKRGTNEWKGGASVSWEPDAGRGSSVYAEKNADGKWELLDRPGYREQTTLNVFGGGPIIQDKLYVFGLFSAGTFKSNVYGNTTQTETKNDTPQYLLKVDWNINNDHTLEFTAFSDKSVDKVGNWDSTTPWKKPRGVFNGNDKYTYGGENYVAEWRGNFGDNFTVSALAGVGNYSRAADIGAANCPIVQDRRVAPTLILGCYTDAIVIDPGAGDKRTAFRVDAAYTLRNHKLKFGFDQETVDTQDGTRYSGGEYFFLRTLAAGATLPNGYVNNTGSAFDYVQNRIFANGGKFKTKNSAFYIADEITVTKDLWVSLGLRSESFQNFNDRGLTFIKIDNTIAPRAGFGWNLDGTGQSRLYGNLGRYYIPVYTNTNVRLSGTETNYIDYWTYGGSLSTDGRDVPVLGAQLGGRNLLSDGLPKDPRTVVDPNLKPMYQDEFILGFERALGNRWTAGVKYIHRNLKSVMDDICEGDLSEAWALANGYTADQAAAIGGTISNCFLYNPGKDLVANVDLDGTGTLTPVRIPASALKMPNPKRFYDALEFEVERQWDKKWSFRGSYVLAFSKGNTEGYVKSDIGQDDAGISQDFDHPGLMEGSNGFLPNDRRHTLKLFGSYAIWDELRVGGTLIAQSGRPKNCFGVYNGPTPDASPSYGGASFYCNGVLARRGSVGRLPWMYDVNLQLNYQPAWAKGMSVTVDALNILNKRTVRAINEVGEEAVSSPEANYQQPILNSIQSPRRFRITASYEF